MINGAYPAARYFSFHVYDSRAFPLDSAFDARIAPDPGSSNPFLAAPPPGSANSYTEYVDFKAAPSNPAPNTLYVGDTEGNAIWILKDGKVLERIGDLHARPHNIAWDPGSNELYFADTTEPGQIKKVVKKK